MPPTTVLDAVFDISIHVPREGDDQVPKVEHAFLALFLSTSPARGTTQYSGYEGLSLLISIHVPREGDDSRLSSRP